MYIARVKVPQPSCSLAKATENGRVKMELLEYILLNENEALFLGRISEVDNLSECFKIIEAHESTKFFQILEKTKTNLDFLAVIEDTTGIKAFEESYCFVKPPIIVENGCKIYTIYAPDVRQLKKAYEKLRGFSGWEVLEVRSLEEKVRLTDKQHYVLKTAYEMGYFEKRRRAKLADIASAINLSKSTVHKHLQESIHKIVEKYFSNSE